MNLKNYAQDAIDERNATIERVLANRDVEGALALADIFADLDDMETATEFKNYARQWQREDWAYDNATEN